MLPLLPLNARKMPEFSNSCFCVLELIWCRHFKEKCSECPDLVVISFTTAVKPANLKFQLVCFLLVSMIWATLWFANSVTSVILSISFGSWKGGIYVCLIKFYEIWWLYFLSDLIYIEILNSMGFFIWLIFFHWICLFRLAWFIWFGQSLSKSLN